MKNLVFLSKVEDLLNKLNIGEGPSSSAYIASSVILSISIILFFGFLMTRITKRLRLPNVTAYILIGVLIGPCVFDIIPSGIISRMAFLSDIALAFIAFQAGEYFKFDMVKKTGAKVIVITLFECLMTFGLIFLLLSIVFRIEMTFAAVLATLASATAPASTIMTIKQTGSKGEYVNHLLEVIVFDNVFTLILYSLTISICVSVNSGTPISIYSIGWPILKTLICLVIGIAFGFLLKLLLPKKRTTDNRLIIVIAVLFLFCGVASLFNESPLLGCMAIGMIYTNFASKDDKLFKQLAYFTPPIMLLFFVRSGMNFDLNAFGSGSMIGITPMIVVVLAYFILRIIGKYGGSFVGSTVSRSDKKIRNYLGLGLIPMAGVAIGLASMGERNLSAAGFQELGSTLNTIILAVSIMYELVGPVLAKLGLYLSHSYSTDIDELVPKESIVQEGPNMHVNTLIEQIRKISSEIPKPNLHEEEDAFTEAALEYEMENSRNPRGFIRRK